MTPANNPEAEKLLQQKKELREKMKKALRDHALDTFAMNMESRQACEIFLNSSVYQNARNLFLFISTEKEIDTSRLILQAMNDGKRIAVPRVIPGTYNMDFYLLDAVLPLEKQLKSGSYNIMEPVTSLMRIDMDQFPVRTVFIVPGLAFSRAGGRLGRGAGFYDRYLSALYSRNEAFRLPAALVGFGFGMQILDFVPLCSYDIPITHILTEKGFMECD